MDSEEVQDYAKSGVALFRVSTASRDQVVTVWRVALAVVLVPHHTTLRPFHVIHEYSS